MCSFWKACRFPALLLAGLGPVAAQHLNLNFNGTSAWKTSATIPANTTPFVFPDGVSRVPADFTFNNGADSVWQLNDLATILCTQTSSGSYNRFFIGNSDGKATRLTFTTGTPESPGKLCARFSNSSAIRIGHATNATRGTLRIDGGVTIQTGYIHGEGPFPALEIVNGRLDVLSGSATRRLNNIAVTLSPRGKLWIEDSAGAVTSAAAFSSFASGATLTATSGTLRFQNQVSVTPVTGSSNKGTLITAGIITDPLADGDQDGLPDQWEENYGLSFADDGSVNPDNGASGDPDHDGLPNLEERTLGSDPRVNESGKAWQPRPEKAAMMVISAHPDDEGIFFGGTIPYYTQVKKIPVVSVSMTSGDYTLPPATREAEFRNAVWAYGLRCQPIFPRFRDSPTNTLDATWDLWADGVVNGNGISAGRIKAARHVASLLRRYRPEVVVTHGSTGEYGHFNHIATAYATIDAFSLAADSAADLEGLPPWQVKKLYVHEWGQKRLFHDFWETPSAALGGLTPRDVANIGLDFHVTQSQPNVSTIWLNGEVSASWGAHPSEFWGLHSTTVGADTPAAPFVVMGTTYTGWAKGDFLEHIDLDLDGNGLPDDWEALRLVDDPASDADGDGLAARTEYIAGTLPGARDGPLLSIHAATRTARFLTRVPSGTGYHGLVRRYRLESSPDLKPGTWLPVWEGGADGSLKEVLLPVQAGTRFYRLVTILE